MINGVNKNFGARRGFGLRALGKSAEVFEVFSDHRAEKSSVVTDFLAPRRAPSKKKRRGPPCSNGP